MRRARDVMAAALLGVAAVRGARAADAVACENSICRERLVYFGTHGSSIFAARFNSRTGHLDGLGSVADLERPTWLVASVDRPILYSVSETGNDGRSQGSVASFAVDPATGKLSLVNKVSSGGGGATHLALDPTSHTLFVANYGTGDVAALPVNVDGSLSPAVSVEHDVGTGPKPRQASPHVHAVAVDPSGRYVLAADLGADRIFVYRLDPATHALSPGDPPFVAAAPGSGPRHIAFVRSGRFVYIDSELSGEVTGYRWDTAHGTLSMLGTVSTASSTYTGDRSAAEIVASRDGRFLYIGNRGEDSIVAYRLNDRTGALTEVQRLAAAGKTPWSFALDPSGRWLLVANEASSTVNVFSVSPDSGRLSPTAENLPVPKPVSIAFAKP